MPFIKLVTSKDVQKNFHFGGILMFKKLNKAFLFAVFALSSIKAQDVSIAVGDTAFAGYTDDIVVPITVSNPNGNIVYGSMVSLVFESKVELNKFVNNINLFSLAESLGGVESLMSVPYFMTHADVPKEVKADMDLVPELLRLAVGIEHIDDLKADIDQALS